MKMVLLGSLCAVFSAAAADVESAYIGKGRTFAQTNASIPIIKPSPFIFEAAVRVTASTNLDDAYWSDPRFPFPPGNRTFIFQPSGKLPLVWSRIDRFTSQTSLDAINPDGDYHIVLDTAHDGSRTNHLRLSGATYPNRPQISNYAAAQSIDPATDFTLEWLALTGGSANDLITLTVMEATNGTGIVFQTGTFPGAPSALDGTRTSVTLPAGTLAPGRVYLGRLRFDKVVSIDSTNYASEVGWAGYFGSTDFYLSTLGADSNTAPRIEAVYPARGAVDVPPDAPLIWTFNKPMQRASSLTTTFTTNRQSFWTTDRRSFVFLPLSPNPPGTNVSWRLQVWQNFVLFGDLMGNPLFTDVNGDFDTGTNLLPPPAQPRLAVPTSASNTVQLLLHGESNRVYAVQFSRNLSDWTSFSTNVTLTGPALITHPAASHGFYRATALR